ncbi:MAG TPA: hypothetical protein VHE35_28940 [Kofleriaceae bacterium]|nr:hypothetical protein [Kofleriaceae bacterium]
MQGSLNDNLEPERPSTERDDERDGERDDEREHIDDPTDRATGLEDREDPERVSREQESLTSKDGSDGLTETDDIVDDDLDEEELDESVLEPIPEGEAG